MTAATAEWLTTDYYEVLGVPPTASAKEVTRAYRRLARKLHPDTRGPDAAGRELDGSQDDRFKAVAAAYAVLGDEARRREYDELRAAARRPRRSPSGGARRVRVTTPGAGAAQDVFGVSLDDLLGSAFGAGSASRTPRRGRDLEASLRLGFEQAVRGATVDLVVPGPAGSGRPVRARIPPGVRDGQTVRLARRGDPGRDGGPPGDLLVHVQVDPHPVLGRDGRDLTVTVPVTYPEAVLGAEVPVPTLDGPLPVRIPPGTASGTRLRVRGRGVPASGRSAAGDLLVTVQVDVPRQLTDAERAAVEQLASALVADPRRPLAA